jgi:hypothetical protein
MGDVIETKRSFPSRAVLGLRDGERPVRVTARGVDYFWIKAVEPIHLPWGRQFGVGDRACVHRVFVRMVEGYA